MHDPRLDALEAAAQLVGADSVDELLAAVVYHARRVVGADWVAVASLGDGDPHAAPDVGPRPDRKPVLVADPGAPSRAWLEAFLHGSRAAEGAARGRPTGGPSDVVWAPLPSCALALVLGRNGMAYRARERRQLAALARVVDTRMGELDDPEPAAGGPGQAQCRERSTARRQPA
jgi:hypothetical protein